MVEVAAFKDTPLLLVLADRVAVGVPPATPVIAKEAEEVELPPTLKS
jgi:hypothetical protein